jgi:serine/threonine-protein kinase
VAGFISVAPESAAIGPGTVVADKYRIEEPIAKGGMGAVWVATNLVLEKKVALKVLRRSAAESEHAAMRLLQEARAAARIGHRNIVQVFDFGYVEGGEPFIVMELLRGETLGERLIRKGRLSAIEAVQALLPVANALAAAHAKGIVHRDMKPWNIFLETDDSGVEIPKIVDFGVAKMNLPQHVPRMTQEGNVVGSPEYLSPEQARGEDDIDARTDVWALTVTLYECMTGLLPFEDPVYNRLLRKIVEDEPMPTTMMAAGDGALWQVVKRGLAKQRDQRWQSAGELGAALQAWLARQGMASSPGGDRFSAPTPLPGLNTPSTLPPPAFDELGVSDIISSPALSSETDTPRLPVKRKSGSRAAMIAVAFGATALVAAAVGGWTLARRGDVPARTATGAASSDRSAEAPIATPEHAALAGSASALASASAAPSAAAGEVPSARAPASSGVARPAQSSVPGKRTHPPGTKAAPVLPTEPNF